MSEIRQFSTLDELSHAAAAAIAELSAAAISQRGRFAIALSGGGTPRMLYQILAKEFREKIDWKHVHLFWGDERYLPQDDPASNFRMAKETLLNQLDIPGENMHAIPTGFPNPAKAVEEYSRELEVFFGTDPDFDLILLGLGSDGHTASIFPATPIEATGQGLAIVTQSPIPPSIRVSLTMNVLNQARNVFFLVAGPEKRGILDAVLADEGNPSSPYPAARVKPKGKLVWFVSPSD